jgi:hypothetical protein
MNHPGPALHIAGRAQRPPRHQHQLRRSHPPAAPGFLSGEQKRSEPPPEDAVLPPDRVSVPCYGRDGLVWATRGPHEFRW